GRFDGLEYRPLAMQLVELLSKNISGFGSSTTVDHDGHLWSVIMGRFDGLEYRPLAMQLVELLSKNISGFGSSTTVD
ncbi:hypothetical protein, partial [Salmonella enterica]|uniref:hypothetical protein n=1 Tax=Salmonella enterica TaxID=28901 RepID=UPI002617E64C